MTSRLVLAALGLSIVLAACGRGDRPRRTWRAEDHSQPEGVGASPGQVAPAPAAGSGSPEAGGDPRMRAAATLYRLRCAGCHGAEGHGDGPERMPAMQPPDFASAEWQSSRSDTELAASIAGGRNLMPPFGEEIGADGIAALVGLVRSMRAP